MQFTATAAGGVLLALMGWSVFQLSFLVQTVVLISILAMVTFFTKPEISLLGFFGVRAIFETTPAAQSFAFSFPSANIIEANKD